VDSDSSPALRHEPPAVGEVDSGRAQGRWLSNRHKSWRQASTGKAWTLASATPNDITEKATGHSKRPPETHPRVAARTEVFGMLRFY
jgi:hypothetical protein